MDDQAVQQLDALASVARTLEGADVPYWVFGGWAVDLHVGRVTRPHDDVDIAVWREDLPRIVHLLEADGWKPAPSEDDDGGTSYEREGVRLELTFLARDDDGEVFTPLRDGAAGWPRGAFREDVRVLRGARARVMGLDALTGGKSAPRAGAEDAAKDRADARLLAQLGRGGADAAPPV